MSMRCPACGNSELREIARLDQVPVHCNVLHQTPALARAAPRGDIVLGFCDACSLLHNTAFDASLLRYDQDYDNSLHFSPRFQTYAQELAQQLLDRHGPSDLDILELGCGKGDFLELLARDGANRCTGFDTSYDETLAASTETPGLRIETAFFSPDTHRERADLLLSRHVLEHLADPTGFVAEMGRGLNDSPAATIFFEVPNGLWTLRDLGIWDLIFEHCSYFTENALIGVFEAAGFFPTLTQRSFGDQFLAIEATRQPGPKLQTECSIDEIRGLAESFGTHLRDKVAAWQQHLAELRSNGQRAVIWGTGSKGVTFLNLVPGADQLLGAIDINPRKTGRYVPGTGQPIHAPDWLADHPVDQVLVMNPIYETEIQAQLATLGSAADTVAV